MQDRKPDQTTDSWRLFIAIELPANIRQKIRAHSDRLRRELPDVRASWTREQNLHLTLKFFGDVQVKRVESLSQALLRAAARSKPFDFIIRECGSFPPRGKPNVLWLGVEDPSGNLLTLHRALEAECANVGFERDKRPFHPHLTIARLRDSKGARNLADLHQTTGFDEVSLRVTDACLVRSELSSASSRYTLIAKHGLMS